MSVFFLFSFFFAHFYFPASGQAVVTGVAPFPPGSCVQLLSRMGFSTPTARRFFIECRKLTLSRFPQVNLSTRKRPNEFIRVCTRRGSNSRN